MVDFVRSIDNVYKELRLLRATVAGSTKIDRGTFCFSFYPFLSHPHELTFSYCCSFGIHLQLRILRRPCLYHLVGIGH